jgi:catechol 2,3-dioxygenase-like lactoylglutathione lyase family enzyme
MDPESFFHVALKVPDVEESLAFYRDHLGGEVVDRGHADDGDGAEAVEHAALAVGDKRVYLFDRAPYEAAGLVADLPHGFLHFGFVVDDAAAAIDDVRAADASVVMEPTVFGDLRVAFVEDPVGVRVEVIEHLS